MITILFLVIMVLLLAATFYVCCVICFEDPPWFRKSKQNIDYEALKEEYWNDRLNKSY